MIDVGAQVGSYRILSKLGEGGMGVVYVAEHTRLGRKVALKVLRPEHAVRPDTLTRFFNEARAVNRIGHEHIVEVTDDGIEPSGEAYFVMELLAGESLSARLKRLGRLPFDQTLHIAVQIADALAASHTHGIVHRDLKPDNVFLITRHNDKHRATDAPPGNFMRPFEMALVMCVANGMRERLRTVFFPKPGGGPIGVRHQFYADFKSVPPTLGNMTWIQAPGTTAWVPAPWPALRMGQAGALQRKLPTLPADRPR